jgi:hypothetical protein
MASASAALLVSFALAAGSGETGSGVAPPPRTAPRAEWDAWNAARAKMGLLPRKRPPSRPRRHTWQFRPPAPAEPSVEAVALAAAADPPVLVAQLDPAQDAEVRPAPVAKPGPAAEPSLDETARPGEQVSEVVAASPAAAPASSPTADPGRAEVRAQVPAQVPGAEPSSGSVPEVVSAAPPTSPAAVAEPSPVPATAGPAVATLPAPAPAPATPPESVSAPPAALAGAFAAVASRPDATMWEHGEADGRTVRIVREPSGALVAAVRAPDGRLLVEIVLLER